MAEVNSMLPIAPHVYFTRVFPEEDQRARDTGMAWGKELMQDCSEIWIFCNEVTEGMIEEISEAKKLGLNMKFYNDKEEEISFDNHFIHTEIGPAYRRIIEEYYGASFHPEGGCAECGSCRKGTGHGVRVPAEDDEDDEDVSIPEGIFDWLFKRE